MLRYLTQQTKPALARTTSKLLDAQQNTKQFCRHLSCSLFPSQFTTQKQKEQLEIGPAAIWYPLALAAGRDHFTPRAQVSPQGTVTVLLQGTGDLTLQHNVPLLPGCKPLAAGRDTHLHLILLRIIAANALFKIYFGFYCVFVCFTQLLFYKSFQYQTSIFNGKQHKQEFTFSFPILT